jgi:hypothetical protein
MCCGVKFDWLLRSDQHRRLRGRYNAGRSLQWNRRTKHEYEDLHLGNFQSQFVGK